MEPPEPKPLRSNWTKLRLNRYRPWPDWFLTWSDPRRNPIFHLPQLWEFSGNCRTAYLFGLHASPKLPLHALCLGTSLSTTMLKAIGTLAANTRCGIFSSQHAYVADVNPFSVGNSPERPSGSRFSFHHQQSVLESFRSQHWQALNCNPSPFSFKRITTFLSYFWKEKFSKTVHGPFKAMVSKNTKISRA